jgi:hypothetical protein
MSQQAENGMFPPGGLQGGSGGVNPMALQMQLLQAQMSQQQLQQAQPQQQSFSFPHQQPQFSGQLTGTQQQFTGFQQPGGVGGAPGLQQQQPQHPTSEQAVSAIQQHSAVPNNLPTHLTWSQHERMVMATLTTEERAVRILPIPPL